MKRLRIGRMVSIALISTACICCASSAPAQTQPARALPAGKTNASSVLTLDIVDRAPSRRADTVRLSLPLHAEGASYMEMQGGEADYRVRVSRQGSPDQPGPLRIDLRRIDRRRVEDEDRRNLQLEVSVDLRAGQRVVIARLDRPNGGSTEVTASLK